MKKILSFIFSLFTILMFSSCEKENITNHYELKYFSNRTTGSVDLIYKTGTKNDSLRLEFYDEYSIKFESEIPISIDAKLKPVTRKENHLHLYKNGQLIEAKSAYDYSQVAIIKGIY